MPWHPVFVHFPIALLSLGFFVDAAALLARRTDWHRIGYLLLVAGSIGAAAAVISGNVAAADYRASIHADAIQDHEDYGTLTLLAYLAACLGRLPAFLRRGDTPLPLPWLLAGGVALCLLAVTSLHGGELVYGRGVGVSVSGSMPSGAAGSPP